MEPVNGKGSPKSALNRSAARMTKKKPGVKTRAAAPLIAVRTNYGISLGVFAKMVHVPPKVLGEWEEGRVSLDPDTAERLGRVATILKGLAHVMRQPFIPIWLTRTNDACKEIGVRTPLDLFKRGDYDELDSMVFYMESGSPE